MAHDQLNIGYEALVSCHEKLVSEIASDPKQMAGLLFQYRFISEDTKERVNQLNSTKRDMARMLVDELQAKVKSFPDYYDKFLIILSQNSHQYGDLLNILQEEYEIKKNICSKDESIPHESEPQATPSSTFSFSFEDLPTFDDKGTIPDPLDSPPDESLVGRDLEIASASHSAPLSTQTSEGKLLRICQANDFENAREILQELEHQSVDLSTVCDSDGKKLLHFACRNDWADWSDIIQGLIEKHHCDVSAVDEDGNTPLHEAYRCGNHSTVTFLLSLPTCDPDTVNKHDHTVLRMALKKNDKAAVRELLATGRVDPRKGTTRGHTYRELLEMDELQPQPQEYDGSALQMVEQLAECIDTNNHLQPPFPSFKHYYLLGTLEKIFKNRHQITISGLVERIKENMLPLPENPGEMYDLLAETWSLSSVDCFTLSSLVDGSVEVTVNKVTDGSQSPPSAVAALEVFQNQPSELVEGTFLRDIDTGSYTLSVPSESTENRHTDDLGVNHSVLQEHNVLEQDVEMTNFSEGTHSEGVDQNNDTEEATPEYNVTEDDTVPLLPPDSSEVTKSDPQHDDESACEKCSKWTIACCTCCFCTFLVLLGVLGGLFYNNRTLSSTASISLIQNPSLPLIGTIDDLSVVNSLRLVESSGSDLVPVTFYILSDCLSDNSIVNTPINDTIRLSFGSPDVKSKEVTELYMLNGSNINLFTDIETVSDSISVDCYAFLIIFNDFLRFITFISQGSWFDEDFAECITDKRSFTSFSATKDSYYYIGIYTDFPTEITTVSMHFVGSYRQYNLTNAVFGCSLTGVQTNCDIEVSELNLNSLQSVCILGLVPSNSGILGLRVANTDLYIAAFSDTTKYVYFFLPLIISASLLVLSPYILCIIAICVVCVRNIAYRDGNKSV